jgi:Txe/YoeB family toxin of Txe-Axe toxin-antitoxin module
MLIILRDSPVNDKRIIALKQKALYRLIVCYCNVGEAEKAKKYAVCLQEIEEQNTGDLVDNVAADAWIEIKKFERTNNKHEKEFSRRLFSKANASDKGKKFITML